MSAELAMTREEAIRHIHWLTGCAQSDLACSREEVEEFNAETRAALLALGCTPEEAR